MADNNKAENKDVKAKPKKQRKNWFKETFSELKKVSWPKFPTVVKQTLAVLALVVVFLAVLLVFDLVLSKLYELLVGSADASLRTILNNVSGLFKATLSRWWL